MCSLNALLLVLLLTISVISPESTDPAEVDYFVNLITEAELNGLTYELPTNARSYAATNPKREDFGSFDFIIIGAGAAGTTAANRLTEVADWSVLLLDAGTYHNNVTDVPHLFLAVQFTGYNWGYLSNPQTGACLGTVNRQCPYPRGRGIGGSTLINNMIYCRGTKFDYDSWATMVNDTRWNYESALHYFKDVENFQHIDPAAPFDPAYHGEGGDITIENFLSRSRQLEIFLEANRELGFEIVDYNANKLGASTTQVYTKNGRRSDYGKEFIIPILKRKNLRVLTESLVTKIHIDPDSKVARGVEFSRNGRNYYATTTKEVLLTAGAIGSPQILMLSGIGPQKHLEEVGIEVIADLSVGEGLHDNPAFYGLTFDSNYSEPIKPLSEYVVEFLHNRGQLVIPSNTQGIGFYESSSTKDTGVANIELLLMPANATDLLSKKSFNLTEPTYQALWGAINETRSFDIYVVNLHARSEGSVRLKSSNPFDYPLIDLNYLSDPENFDIDLIYEGILLVLKLINTRAFQAIDARIQGGPLPACQQHQYLSKEYWYCAIRQLTFHLYHAQGTCKMGTDPKKGDVVDSKLRVFGVEKLRVADASVFPLTLGSHTSAPSCMVGAQLADIIKEAYL